MTEPTTRDDPAMVELRKPPQELIGRRHGWARIRQAGKHTLMLVGLLGLAVGLYGLRSSGDTASCLNSALSARNASSDTEITAQITKAEADLTALQEIRVDPPLGFKEYTKAAADFVTALQSVQDARKNHPLGGC